MNYREKLNIENGINGFVLDYLNADNFKDKEEIKELIGRKIDQYARLLEDEESNRAQSIESLLE